MITWGEYFAGFGVMFVIYAIIRIGIWLDFRSYRKPLPEKPWDGSATFINISPLAERIQHVKEDYGTGPQARPADFKKPLMVEEKRKEIAQLAFFQNVREPAPEEHEDDGGPALLLV
jgi:hypothetical protein